MSEGWEEKAAGHSVDVEPQLPEKLGWGVWSTPALLGDGYPWSKLLFLGNKVAAATFSRLSQEWSRSRKRGKKIKLSKEDLSMPRIQQQGWVTKHNARSCPGVKLMAAELSWT